MVSLLHKPFAFNTLFLMSSCLSIRRSEFYELHQYLMYVHIDEINMLYSLGEWITMITDRIVALPI